MPYTIAELRAEFETDADGNGWIALGNVEAADIVRVMNSTVKAGAPLINRRSALGQDLFALPKRPEWNALSAVDRQTWTDICANEVVQITPAFESLVADIFSSSPNSLAAIEAHYKKAPTLIEALGARSQEGDRVTLSDVNEALNQIRRDADPSLKIDPPLLTRRGLQGG